ncbi:hypothetical protein BRC81_15135 [Halobacteriales archaeon QS_1_68_20]|nr:MAG: hypothetical protein BRC81_15135 [Halobacteriales archaeon QS_1_68_20]
MVTTRGALAVLGLLVLTVAVVAMRRDRQVEAAWLMAAGFGIATIWGVLSVLLAEQGQAGIPRVAAVSLTTMAASITFWALFKAVNREPIT